MTFTDAQVTQAISAWLFPFFRIGAVITVAPIFSTRAVPARYRVLLAAAVTVLIAPLAESTPAVDPFSGEAVVVIAQQIAIGVAIGFVLQLAFAALVFGGQVVAYGMGLGFAHLMDPQNGVQVPTVSQFYMIFATLAFLLADGHLRLIALLVQSFETVPVSAEGITRANLWELAGWGTHLFADGLLLALPVVAALLLVSIGMGLVSRAAPQLNVFAVGFPVTLGLGFILMLMTLPEALARFSEWVDAVFELAGGLLIVR